MVSIRRLLSAASPDSTVFCLPGIPHAMRLRPAMVPCRRMRHLFGDGTKTLFAKKQMTQTRPIIRTNFR